MAFFQSQRVCVMLTGASRGFGVSIATTLANHYRCQFSHEQTLESNNSLSQTKDNIVVANDTNDDDDRNPKLLFILIARNGDKLNTVGNQLRQIDNRINFISIECDLSARDSSETILKKLNDNKSFVLGNFGHLILVHNAGSVGDPNCLCRTISCENSAQREIYYRLNLYSVMELTGLLFRLRNDSSKPSMKFHIVNVSSLAAVTPFKGLVDYCVGKAAREAYFRSLIHEEDSSEEKCLRVLNYAPGPLETEMLEQLRNEGFQREAFQKLTALTPEQSAKKMMELLVNDQYSNGAHIDYYDP